VYCIFGVTSVTLIKKVSVYAGFEHFIMCYASVTQVLRKCYAELFQQRFGSSGHLTKNDHSDCCGHFLDEIV